MCRGHGSLSRVMQRSDNNNALNPSGESDFPVFSPVLFTEFRIACDI